MCLKASYGRFKSPETLCRRAEGMGQALAFAILIMTAAAAARCERKLHFFACHVTHNFGSNRTPLRFRHHHTVAQWEEPGPMPREWLARGDQQAGDGLYPRRSLADSSLPPGFDGPPGFEPRYNGGFDADARPQGGPGRAGAYQSGPGAPVVKWMSRLTFLKMRSDTVKHACVRI